MILKAILIFALLFLFMMMGAPMAIALGASTVITLVCTTSLGITTIATACFSGLDSFPLLAVPFFILAGNLMKFGGLSNKILEFADALVGHIKGSLGMVAGSSPPCSSQPCPGLLPRNRQRHRLPDHPQDGRGRL